MGLKVKQSRKGYWEVTLQADPGEKTLLELIANHNNKMHRMKEWCQENFGNRGNTAVDDIPPFGRWDEHGSEGFRFRYEEDANIFILRWS